MSSTAYAQRPFLLSSPSNSTKTDLDAVVDADMNTKADLEADGVPPTDEGKRQKKSQEVNFEVAEPQLNHTDLIM